MQFYQTYKVAKPGPARDDQQPALAFKTKAVVFDFYWNADAVRG